MSQESKEQKIIRKKLTARKAEDRLKKIIRKKLMIQKAEEEFIATIQESHSLSRDEVKKLLPKEK